MYKNEQENNERKGEDQGKIEDIKA